MCWGTVRDEAPHILNVQSLLRSFGRFTAGEEEMLGDPSDGLGALDERKIP